MCGECLQGLVLAHLQARGDLGHLITDLGYGVSAALFAFLDAFIDMTCHIIHTLTDHIAKLVDLLADGIARQGIIVAFNILQALVQAGRQFADLAEDIFNGAVLTLFAGTYALFHRAELRAELVNGFGRIRRRGA